MEAYAELQTTTNFSFLRGGSHPHELAGIMAELGYRAFGVADRNTLAGVVRAWEAAGKAGIRCLIGCRLEELPQDAVERARMNENHGPVGTPARLAVDHLGLCGSQGFERRRKVLGDEADVMHAFAPLVQEPRDTTVAVHRLG